MHRFVYSVSVSSPCLSRAASLRISAVCGKEPIVVVGKMGRLSAARCFSWRAAKGLALSSPASSTASRRCLTSDLWIKLRLPAALHVFEVFAELSQIAHGFATARVPRSATISSSFCRAKASQPLYLARQSGLVLFKTQIARRVQQRAGRRDHQTLGTEFFGGLADQRSRSARNHSSTHCGHPPSPATV